MSDDFEISGTSEAALFTLKLHRGEGMVLIAMNWKQGTPPADFVGFAIEYKEPNGDRFFAVKNRIGFPAAGGAVGDAQLSTMLSPIQKFRWVHFPFNANLDGAFLYRVTPLFMNARDELSQGEPQQAAIVLRRETYPGQLNVCFTRGFVSSQAFVDRYNKFGPISTLLPAKAEAGLAFMPTHPKAKEALAWMGFEAHEAIIGVLDEAIADETAQVRVIAYDLNEPEVVDRLEKLGSRLKVIVDDSKGHGGPDTAETAAATRLDQSTGGNMKRQHMSSLQHNKTIAVSGAVQKVICGSTNLSWRGFFVQANNAVVLEAESAVKLFFTAFETYFDNPDGFRTSDSAQWHDIGFQGIDAHVAFSPHGPANALLQQVADDISENTSSCLFYSLAFLFETPGVIRDALETVSKDNAIFVYGISDKEVGGGLDLQMPDGNVSPVFATALTRNAPPPFSEEPTGGGGTRMHHKFVVIDFDKPTARVYFGSYNFSTPADTKNGENLLVIRDRRIAVSYTIEALRIFDHYHFRIAQQVAETAQQQLQLQKPPRNPGEKPWWDEDYTNARKVRDRELFA